MKPILLAAGLSILFVTPALAQEGDDLVDIGEVGSSRIGGPGLTKSERARERAFDEPDEYITEDNLPKAGSKKRLPALHVLAVRGAKGKDWETACEKYDQIVEEGGDEAMDIHPDAKKYAWRAYLGCADRLISREKYDKAERFLKKSEKWGPSDFRHARSRREMQRAAYHSAASAGDYYKAVELFQAYHAIKPDEDERIWLGEQLAAKAVEADKLDDKKTREEMMKLTEKVAPQNTDLRMLKEKIETGEGIIQKMGMYVILALLGVIGFVQFGKWRGRRHVEAAAGGKLRKKNKFIDDDDL